MRETSVYAVECPCGLHHEWPASISWKRCGCGRLLVVEAFPNHPLVTIHPEASYA